MKRKISLKLVNKKISKLFQTTGKAEEKTGDIFSCGDIKGKIPTYRPSQGQLN